VGVEEEQKKNQEGDGRMKKEEEWKKGRNVYKEKKTTAREMNLPSLPPTPPPSPPPFLLSFLVR
jgi:hypothetical protein